MTIKRGQDWGTVGPLSADAQIAHSDRELAEFVALGHTECGLVGGDLAHTIGARATDAELGAGRERTRLPVDLGRADIDGTAVLFVAHLIVRRAWWADTIIVAQACFRGDWNIAPAGHPNDGRLDLIDASLGIADRIKARKRLPSGSHVPHPKISIRRVTTGEIAAKRGAKVWVDGEPHGRFKHIVYRIDPDALTLVI